MIGETVKFVREETVCGMVEEFVPVGVEEPVLPVLPVRWDTVVVERVVYRREVVDTAAIVADYALKRSYAALLFDNEYGRMNLSLSTQYNRPESVSYEFVPVTRLVYRDRVWQPFIMASFSSLGSVGAGAGVFYMSTGASVQCVTDFKRVGVGVSVYRIF
jgi:hypothetical protein